MSANVDLVHSIYAAWDRRDYEWVEWADPAIEFVIADGPSPGRYEGLEGMWRGWRDVLSPWLLGLGARSGHPLRRRSPASSAGSRMPVWWARRSRRAPGSRHFAGASRLSHDVHRFTCG